MMRCFFALLLVAGCIETPVSELRAKRDRAVTDEDELVIEDERDAGKKVVVVVDAAPPAPKADASPSPTTPTIDAFSNAKAYTTITPATQSARHDGYRTNAGMDCMSCHDGKTPQVPRFLIAGTVYATKEGATGARNVEVRVVSPEGKEVASVGTDDAGNFWLKAGALLEIPAGSVVGARNARSTMRMAAKLVGGAGVSCNRCHSSDATVIWVN